MELIFQSILDLIQALSGIVSHPILHADLTLLYFFGVEDLQSSQGTFEVADTDLVLKMDFVFFAALGCLPFRGIEIVTLRVLFSWNFVVLSELVSRRVFISWASLFRVLAQVSDELLLILNRYFKFATLLLQVST